MYARGEWEWVCVPAYKYNDLSTQAAHSRMEVINAHEPSLYSQRLQRMWFDWLWVQWSSFPTWWERTLRIKGLSSCLPPLTPRWIVVRSEMKNEGNSTARHCASGKGAQLMVVAIIFINTVIHGYREPWTDLLERTIKSVKGSICSILLKTLLNAYYVYSFSVIPRRVKDCCILKRMQDSRESGEETSYR